VDNVKPIRWSTDKNLALQKERGVSFEEVLASIENGGLLATLAHPNAKQYAHQKLWVVRMRGYAYLVPFVETKDEVFLKTIIPSRKATKQLLQGTDDASVF
jgi:uncharacterized DUF497 family protein